MVYEYYTPKKPRTFIRTYVARIVGPDEVYKLRRIFLQHTCYEYAHGKRYYATEIGSHGVFEVSISYCDKETEAVLERERYYFACSYCEQWDIERKDVLDTVELIKSLGPHRKKAS